MSFCKRKIIVVSFCVIVGLLHFIVGPGYDGLCKTFVSGYLIDILLPCAMYLLLTVSNIKISRVLMAVFVLLFGFSVETLQYFNVHIFGETFDPIDFIMYTLGVGVGVLIDLKILPK